MAYWPLPPFPSEGLAIDGRQPELLMYACRSFRRFIVIFSQSASLSYADDCCLPLRLADSISLPLRRHYMATPCRALMIPLRHCP